MLYTTLLSVGRSTTYIPSHTPRFPTWLAAAEESIILFISQVSQSKSGGFYISECVQLEVFLIRASVRILSSPRALMVLEFGCTRRASCRGVSERARKRAGLCAHGLLRRARKVALGSDTFRAWDLCKAHVLKKLLIVNDIQSFHLHGAAPLPPFETLM
jgi:hypothetical protein